MSDYQPIKTQRTYEVIVDLIKEKIFSGEYQPGDQLPVERDMARMTRVSRAAVREAYHALELFEIVEIRKGTGGGAFIKEPSHHSITQSINDLIRLRRISMSDMTEARLLLEKNMAEIAVNRITTEVYEKLENAITAAFERLDRGMAAPQENIRFHIHLAEASGNSLLVMVYTSLMDVFGLVLRQIGGDVELSRIVTEEHQEIVRLLKKGDLEELLNFLDQHIRGSNQRLLKNSQDYPILEAIKASRN